MTIPAVNTYIYTGNSFSTSGTNSNIHGLKMDINGNHLYSCDDSGIIWQYDFGTSFDALTLAYNSKSLNVLVNTSENSGIDISSDGTKLFICNAFSSPAILEYTLSTPYDVTTGIYTAAFSLPQVSTGSYLFLSFSDNGMHFYISDQSSIWQYDMSVAYSILTASYSGNTWNSGDSPADLYISSGGNYLQFVNEGSPLRGFNLGTNYSLVSPVANGTLSLSSQMSTSYGIAGGNSGLNYYLYIYDLNSNVIYEYIGQNYSPLFRPWMIDGIGY